MAYTGEMHPDVTPKAKYLNSHAIFVKQCLFCETLQQHKLKKHLNRKKTT